MTIPIPGYANRVLADASITAFDDGTGAPLVVSPTVGLPIRAQRRAASEVTIGTGSSVTATMTIDDAVLLAIIMPAAWTTAALNLEVSADGTTWVAPLDSTGTAVCSFAVPVVSAGYAMDLPSLMPWRYARLRSGTSATPVNQAAARVFQVVTRSLA